MGTIRHYIFGNLVAAWALIALTLCMKIVVPVGFMPHVMGGSVALVVCNGMETPAPVAAMPSMTGHHHHGHAPSKPDVPCPFAGLAAPTLGGADPVQLATLIVAILAIALRPAAPQLALTAAHLRPPLRGPPART